MPGVPAGVIKNGYMWCFDTNKQYLGASKWFDSQITGFNPSSSFTFKIAQGSVTNSTIIANIKYCVFVLVDGAETADNAWDYNYRSISPYFTVY